MGTGEGCLVRAEVVYGGGDAHFGIEVGHCYSPESEGASGSRGLSPSGVPPDTQYGLGTVYPKIRCVGELWAG